MSSQGSQGSFPDLEDAGFPDLEDAGFSCSQASAASAVSFPDVAPANASELRISVGAGFRRMPIRIRNLSQCIDFGYRR